MPKTIILDDLRRLILVKVGIKIISPSDCRFISMAIQKELHKTISETTIKRLFGFAEIKNNFSKYTINTLLEFLEKSPDLIENEQLVHDPTAESFTRVHHQATEVTIQTVRFIRNRCSVPYELTISRKFAKYDFEYFYASEESFTAFISQPDYGKSILLSHLVQEMFINDKAKYKNDIFLFLKASDVFDDGTEPVSITTRVKEILGLYPQTDLISYFNQQNERLGIKCIIIIDGFSDLIIKKSARQNVSEKLIELIADIGKSTSTKLILSMRSTTWSRFYEKLRFVPSLNEKWFPGSYFNADDHSNIPALTDHELEDIFKLMCPTDFSRIDQNIKSGLKFPFHIQSYYHLQEEYPSFNSFTNITFYEIIDRFIQEKIYQSNYATEKLLYCKKIIRLSNYGRTSNRVLKSDLNKELTIFKNAYKELLADGILMEEKGQNGQTDEYLRFTQPHAFEYFLFISLLEAFDQKMDHQFFENLNNEYFGNQVRFQLLQWSIRLMVKCNQFDQLHHVLKLKINNYERNYLIYFIAENLNYKLGNDPELMDKIKINKIHNVLIEHLIHLDFIDSCYIDAIKSLIHIVDTEEHALLYHVILSISECLSLDQERMQARIETMETLGNEAKKWEIDPLQSLKLIHLKIKGVPVKHDDILIKISAFKNGEDNLGIHGESLPNTRQILVFLSMLMVNLFYGTHKETIKIINAITNLYPKIRNTKKPLTAYLLNLMALAESRTAPNSKTDQMERILEVLYRDNSSIKPTVYAQSLFLMLKAQQCKNRKEYTLALQYAKECVLMFQRNNLKVNEISCYNLIISIYMEVGDKEKANEYIYKKLSILDENKVNPIPFHNLVNS